MFGYTFINRIQFLIHCRVISLSCNIASQLYYRIQLTIEFNMSNLITNFESELIEKIRQKSSSKQSMDSFLFKNFKFFDLINNGRLPRSDFFKAIAKCGVVVQPNDLSAVFQHYAGEGEMIDYPKFIEEIVYREEEIESNSSRLKFSQKSQLFQPDSRGLAASKVLQEEKAPLKESKFVSPPVQLQTYDAVLSFIKKNIQSEGMGSLLSLAVRLKQTDKDKTHLVNRNTLAKLLGFLSKDHLALIIGELSQNGNQIDYSVLVYDLKGHVEEEVCKEIDATFSFLDSRREGEFPIDYLTSRYLNRGMQDQFRRAVDLYAKFQGIDDGTFTEDDFNDFLGFLSFDYSSIEDFRKHIIRPFYEDDNKSTLSQKSNRTRDFQLNKSQKGLPESNVGDFRKDKRAVDEHDEEEHFQQFHEDLHADDKKSVSRYSQFEGHELTNSNKLKIFQSVILRIKKRLASKGTRGFLLLEKAMKNADANQDTLLTADEFTQVIKAQRIDITPTECSSIYDLFDSEGVGLISFAEFMFTLRGSMAQPRKEMADKLWSQIKNTDQTTSFSKIRHLLNFRSHPDVQTGRRYQQDIWKEIQETILTIQELNGAPRSDTITKAEFEEYMENLSLSVIDDRLFESILLNFWRLDNSSSILEKYAGSRKLFDQSKNGYLMDHHRNYVKGGTVSQNAPFGTFHEPTSYITEHRKL